MTTLTREQVGALADLELDRLSALALGVAPTMHVYRTRGKPSVSLYSTNGGETPYRPTLHVALAFALADRLGPYSQVERFTDGCEASVAWKNGDHNVGEERASGDTRALALTRAAVLAALAAGMIAGYALAG